MKKVIFQMTNKSHFINPDHIVKAYWTVKGTFDITLSTGEKIELDESESKYLLEVFDFETPL